MAVRGNVLVVDGEPDICRALEKVLQGERCRSMTATTARQVLELVKFGPPFRMALIDGKLPDMDGLKLASLVRRIDPRVAIVLISGYFHRGDRLIVEGLQRGAYAGFIAKPFDPSEVRLVVKKVLRAHRGSWRSALPLAMVRRCFGLQPLLPADHESDQQPRISHKTREDKEDTYAKPTHSA